jgi:hypothetical protein
MSFSVSGSRRGCLLLWIAGKLTQWDEDSEGHIKASEALWPAVRTIAIADARPL